MYIAIVRVSKVAYIKTVAKVVEGEFREICEQIGAKTELYLGIRQPPFPLMGV